MSTFPADTETKHETDFVTVDHKASEKCVNEMNERKYEKDEPIRWRRIFKTISIITV
jgi:hypothetical protein